MVVAYHQSAEEVQFLIRRWGFPKAVEALKLFATGKDTKAVIPAVTGLTIAQYDEAFREDLRQRLKSYDGTFVVTTTDYSDVEALEEKLKANPNDLRVKGLYAMALMKANRRDEAQKLVDTVDLSKASDRQKREIVLASA
jgi:hypothetical protein